MTLDPDEPQVKLRGGYPGAETRPTRTVAPGDRVGSLEVDRDARATPPGHVAFLDPRDGTLICGDAFSTLGGVATTAQVNLRFPLVGDGDVAPARPSSRAPARCARSTRRALAPGHGQGRRVAGGRDGRGDRRAALTMPRQGSTPNSVVDAAARLADADGLDAVTLARRRRRARRARRRRSTTTSTGRDGAAAPDQRCAAWRELDRRDRHGGGRPRRAPTRCARPRTPTASTRARSPGLLRGDARRAARRRPRARRPPPRDCSRLMSRCCASGSSRATRLVDAIRVIRSALHGFVTLERRGGFAMPATSTPPSTG